jgi:hypothetical protein
VIFILLDVELWMGSLNFFLLYPIYIYTHIFWSIFSFSCSVTSARYVMAFPFCLGR